MPAGPPRAGVVFAHPLPIKGGFRGVGRSAGAWDNGRGEMDDYKAAFDLGSDNDRICAMIGIAPPVNRYEFASVKLSTKPKFIVHGESDELIPLKLVREFYARLQAPREFVEIDRANHLFDGQASEVGDALEELLTDFTCGKP